MTPSQERAYTDFVRANGDRLLRQARLLVPHDVEAIAARARLDAILRSLPSRQRITVVLRVIEGLSEVETAEVMDCSPGTVKSNLARGLDKVRAAMPATLEETAL